MHRNLYLLCLVVVLGCPDDRVTGPSVANISIGTSPDTVFVGTPLQLSATTYGADGAPLSGRGIVWGTSNSTIATVSLTGLVTGLTAGDVTITATSEGKSATRTLMIRQPSPPPTPTILAAT